MAQKAQLIFGGDMMIARGVTAQLAAGKQPAAFWGNIHPRLLAADAVVANLECPITTTPQRYDRGFKVFRFRADPGVIDILKAGNVRCVALANNHMLDCNPIGMFDTLDALDAAGIVHTGAGANLLDALEPALFTGGGVKIGFVSITNTMHPFAAGAKNPGTALLEIRTDNPTVALLGRIVAALKREGAELLVLSVHWGPNYRPWPPQRYRRFARLAVELGFDIVHGHSAHLFQAVEFHGAGLILYDTGDFLDDFWIFPGLRTDRSFLFEVAVSPGEPPALKLTPVLLKPGEANFAEGREAAAIADIMVKRCRNFPVEFTRDGDVLLARPRGG